MPKTINWPLQCFDAVRTTSDESIQMAVRLGTLYFEHQYWVAGDVVDIRVNSEVIRSAEIVGEMKSCAIRDLSPSDVLCFKPNYQSHEGIVSFLQTTYPDKHAEHPITLDTIVSVVYYKNQPVLDSVVL